MSVYVFLADGFEEVEALTPIDFLRRAGIELITVSLNDDLYPTGSHNVTVKADIRIADFADSAPDAIICPGGMPGSANLAANADLVALLRESNDAGVLMCAICAAPAVTLGRSGAGILGNRRFTCYPGFEDQAGSGIYTPERVLYDEGLITAVGAGAAAEFSVAIIEHLKDKATASAVHTTTIQP
ncbi:MAG: DJ-1 family glyoxalase III [Salinispira sp.]